MAELGYDAAFLHTPLAPPETPADAAEPSTRLDYVHFSLGMHPTRRLAWWVAWNIDGLRLFPSESLSRGGEGFRLDRRLPEDAQTGERVYSDNELDRGHIARRADLLWGASLDEARQAGFDSFYFTNITPQHEEFNQSGRGGTWGLLENAVLALEGLADRRVTLFAGPVLHPDDPPYRDLVQLPVEHWKVVAYRLGEELRFKAFVLAQDLDDISERRVPDFLEEFDTYQVPLDLLEERTGLTFPSLHGIDTHELPVSGPTLVTDAEQVSW